MTLKHLSLLTLAAALALVGCDSSDPDPLPIDESRTFTVTIENVGDMHPVLKSGAVAQPEGMGPPIEPGESVSFSFTAPANTLPMSGMRFNMATMFVQSNDLFYAFPPEGLALYDDDGDAITGDVTEQIFLYDAGTEVNEEPGQGEFQKLVQDPMATDVGPDEGGVILLIEDDGTDVMGFEYPDKEDVIQVTVDHDGASTFTITVANVSEPGLIEGTDRAMGAVPLSPFAWAVHVNTSPDGYSGLYQLGEPASQGIELIAEDGFPADELGGMDLPPDAGLADELAPLTGITVPLSPGAWAVHSDAVQLFEVGGDASEGIEAIAEDGLAGPLGMALAGLDGVEDSGTFVRGDGAEMDGAIGPGGSFTFTFDAEPGDLLSFATMYVQSNDLYYAFRPEGLALFDGDAAVTGDVTDRVLLYDAGTEGDQEPGVGPAQVIRQPEFDFGPAGEGSIVRIGDGGSDDGYTYPPSGEIIRVTISAQ